MRTWAQRTAKPVLLAARSGTASADARIGLASTSMASALVAPERSSPCGLSPPARRPRLCPGAGVAFAA